MFLNKIRESPSICERILLKINKYLIIYSLRPAVLKTRKFQAKPSGKAEIHTVLNHTHVYQYLLAIKSFLRFYDDVSVVVHDDGTLSDSKKKTLEDHIPGIKIIDRKKADAEIEKLLREKKYSLINRKLHPIFFQVIDNFIFSSSEKIINFDSDLLFFERPDEVIDWIEGKENVIRYNFEKNAGSQARSADGEIVILGENFPFRLLKGINGGFVCTPRKSADLDLLEEYLKYMEESKRFKRYLLYAQNAIGMYVMNSQLEHQPLLPDRYKVLWDYKDDPEGFCRESVFKHYNHHAYKWNKQFGYKADMAKIIKDLKTKKGD